MSPGRMLTGAHLQKEGVIRSVEDPQHLLLYSVLQNLLSHLCYAFYLGVNRADERFLPLVQLVTHQSKAKWQIQKNISGLLQRGTEPRF